MVQNSNSRFSAFAFLAFICAAVSGCSSTHLLSSDPQTAEDILDASTQHLAHVTLANGITVHCYSVTVRKDSTRWRLSELGPEVSVPTDSVDTIEVPNPKTGVGILIGAPVGALAGFVIGAATYTPPPPTNLNNDLEDIFGFDGLAVALTGGLIGILAGGILGGVIGASNGTVWTTH
jgi:hypothetical protein